MEERERGEPDARRPRRVGALRALASLRLTAILLAALTIVLIGDAQRLWTTEVPRNVLLSALALNLAANLTARWRTFARKPGLLAFHLGLIAIVALSLVGRALAVDAELLLLEGQSAPLRRVGPDAGWATPRAVLDHRIALLGVETRYVRADTPTRARATLRVTDPGGRPVFEGAVEPNEPVDAGPLRVYLTTGRGFGAVVRFRPRGGRPVTGVLLFPEYRKRPGDQAQSLLLPGVDEPLRAELRLGADLYRADGPWELRVPLRSKVALSTRGARRSALLSPGGTMRLGEGLVTLIAIRRWSSLYAVYDPTEDWVVALVFALPLLLVVHYLVGRWRLTRPGRPLPVREEN